MDPLCPIAVVENAGFREGYKKIVSLSELAQSEFFKLEGPVCLILGKVLLDSDYMKRQDFLRNSFLFRDLDKKIENACHGR